MFIVIELQANGEQVSTITQNYANQNEAESRYHQILAAAAISQVPVHSAIVMDEKCIVYQCATYEHPAN